MRIMDVDRLVLGEDGLDVDLASQARLISWGPFGPSFGCLKVSKVSGLWVL